MNMYTVTITETLQRTVYVLAPSAEAAKQMMKDQYRDGNIVLNADDFTGITTYDVEEEE